MPWASELVQGAANVTLGPSAQRNPRARPLWRELDLDPAREEPPEPRVGIPVVWRSSQRRGLRRHNSVAVDQAARFVLGDSKTAFSAQSGTDVHLELFLGLLQGQRHRERVVELGHTESVSPVRFHDLRHTFGTRMARADPDRRRDR